MAEGEPGDEEILRRHMALFSRFPADIQTVILRFVGLFLKGKRFEGKNGLEVTRLHHVLIAGNAALVGATQRVSCFDSVRWVLLYPDLVHIDGEAFTSSKVVLSWQCVLDESMNPSLGANLVVHEFAHVLDYLLGVSHSTDNMVAAFEHCEEVLVGEGETATLFRPEDIESPEEFFCAASELFFTAPVWLQQVYPGLYGDLESLYGLDMARYLPWEDGSPPGSEEISE